MWNSEPATSILTESMLKRYSAMNNIYFEEKVVETSMGSEYHGLLPVGETSAVIVLRAGAAFEVRFVSPTSPV